MGLLVEEQLGEPFVARVGDGAAARRPGEDGLAVRGAIRPQLVLGGARPGDLRIGERHRGNGARVEEALLARRRFRRDMAFVDGLVRQHGRAGDIADGEDVRHVGAHLLVGLDVPALVDVHAGRVKAGHNRPLQGPG